VYKSADGGKTWIGLARVSNPGGYPSALAIDPQHPTIVYAAIRSAVRRSTDAGGSWRSIRQGLPAKIVITLAADPQRSGTVYAGLALEGIYKTTNGGRSSRRASSGFSVTALAVDPAGPTTIFAAGDAFKGGNESENRILRSSGSGRTGAIAG
jgi:photosystem II stability/assembly factor-like uncharacterized protein